MVMFGPIPDGLGTPDSNVGEWLYEKPKWYHVKYRGGTLVYHHPCYEELPDNLRAAIKAAHELAKEGQVKWSVRIEDDGRHIEVETISIRFKTPDDVIIFRLQHT